MRVLIYGAGQTGSQILSCIRDQHEVIGFLDGNPEKKGVVIDNINVLGDVEILSQISYDKIYIGTVFWKPVKKKLLDAGVKESQIVIDLPDDSSSPIRDIWLECYGKLYGDTELSVAEAGVYRGNFASNINKAFPHSTLHLFDTFEGFDKRDVLIEKSRYSSNIDEYCFSNTSVDLVISKMPFPQNIRIHKGFFPDTAIGIDDSFVFVNLDFDLYQPILEGLRFFYPKMVFGAILLVHDFFHIGLPGIRDAINSYEKEIKHTLVKLPIGDHQSIAIVKT